MADGARNWAANVRTAAPVRRFYRVVTTNPPTLRDFLSLKALGRHLRPSASVLQRHIYDGLSVSSNIASAGYTAKRYPRTGAFIAILDVPDDGRFVIEQTTPTLTHYTIWGDAAAVMACMTTIVSLEEAR